MDRNLTLNSVVATGRLGVVGAWLMLLYVVTIATAIMAFSAFQFQTALGSIEASEGALTIGELESERKSFNAKQELINSARVAVNSLETDLASVRQEANDVLVVKYDKKASESMLRDEILEAAVRLEAPLIDIDKTDLSDLIVYLNDLPRLTTTKEIHAAQLESLLGKLKSIARETYAIQARSVLLNEQSQQLEERRVAAQERLTSMTSDILQRPELIGLFQQMEFFEGVPLGRSFATMPPVLLIPIVTLAMGALGSVIYLSVSIVLGEPPRPFVWYLFRPMLGMVTAFAVFILVQAGALVVTQPLAEGGPGQLNPYFIAFVAIVSGLLSEQAVERIRRVGGSFFSTQDGEAVQTAAQHVADDQTAGTYLPALDAPRTLEPKQKP